MTDRPYPAGTRVVLTWSHCTHLIGLCGVCTSDLLHPGETVKLTDEPGDGTPASLAQYVEWDDGVRAAAQVRYLRPLSDPDAEPVVERQAEEEPA